MIDIKKFAVKLFIAVFCASVALNGWLAFLFFKSAETCQVGQINVKTLAFANMFVKDVLMQSQEIDFDTRLSLETAVRALNDKQIFDQWQKFTKCQTKEDASTQAKLLLDLLIKKIRVIK